MLSLLMVFIPKIAEFGRYRFVIARFQQHVHARLLDSTSTFRGGKRGLFDSSSVVNPFIMRFHYFTTM